ncbi:hypothetical protein [Streptomyces profundus]|uniref:hypothetical protein n=1 Tax=Streptomyces profundus TaxID=2867410 RepID=UPI001D160DBA|nr:hypothetical protein [Streptomyces sp. MA3_2.13]UED86509.1 hypothetical protein K4G22_21855 [Streptomyces sp. MA3_2.13]
MEVALVLFFFLALTFVASAIAVRRGVRALQRRATVARQELRRRAGDAALSARAAQPGAVGEVARLRKELRAGVEGTRAILLAGVAHDPSLGEALALSEQLAGHAARLDAELASLVAAGERDRAVIAARLPALRERAERIRASAFALREAANERARHDEGEDLDTLQERIALEAKALRHWSPTIPGAARPSPPAGRAVDGPAPGSGGSGPDEARG